MKRIKVLNLYSGIGGNRKLWENVEVTAIEKNIHIAEAYRHFFPDDTVIATNAHKYLLENYDKFDFIWSSPPCPTHSRIRNVAGVGSGQNKPVYPDMTLYEEIIFLNQVFHSSGTAFNGRFVVENVKSYYDPLIKPYEVGRHYMWSNFHIPNEKDNNDMTNLGTIDDLTEIKGFDLRKFPVLDAKKILRNCVRPEIGLMVFNAAFKLKQKGLVDFNG